MPRVPRLVLVVVGDDAARASVAESLRRGGFGVLPLGAGDDARRVLDFVLPAAVVLDASLRAPTALTLLMELAHRAIAQPTVLVSADGSGAPLAELFAIDHLELPCDARALVDVVDRAIDEEHAPHPTGSGTSLAAAAPVAPGVRASRR